MRENGECDDGAKYASMRPNSWAYHSPSRALTSHWTSSPSFWKYWRKCSLVFRFCEGNYGSSCRSPLSLHSSSCNITLEWRPRCRCIGQACKAQTSKLFVLSGYTLQQAGGIDLVGVVILDPFKIKKLNGWMIDLEISAIHHHETPTAVILFESVVKIDLV